MNMAKKSNNTDKKLFDKKADIYTANNGQYHIRKNRVYICGSDYYGKVYTISSNKYNRGNVHIIKEFYPYDNKRLRFLIVNFKDAKKFRTIEKLPDGTERGISVIESFTDASEYICSIGDIKHIISDIEEANIDNTNNKVKENTNKRKPKILKYIPNYIEEKKQNRKNKRRAG